MSMYVSIVLSNGRNNGRNKWRSSVCLCPDRRTKCQIFNNVLHPSPRVSIRVPNLACLSAYGDLHACLPPLQHALQISWVWMALLPAKLTNGTPIQECLSPTDEHQNSVLKNEEGPNIGIKLD